VRFIRTFVLKKTGRGPKPAPFFLPALVGENNHEKHETTRKSLNEGDQLKFHFVFFRAFRAFSRLLGD
jgi:hypothetical protein